MSLQVEGLDELYAFSEHIGRTLSSSSLQARALELAMQAGLMLKEAVVEQCVREIYEMSEGDEALFTPMMISAEGRQYGGSVAERTGALKESHELISEGLIQTVQIDPNAPALPAPHNGRVEVMDYALAVHDGYTQWYFGHNTGVFHIGRPWFDHAVETYGEEILNFVIQAFIESCVLAWEEA